MGSRIGRGSPSATERIETADVLVAVVLPLPSRGSPSATERIETAKGCFTLEPIWLSSAVAAAPAPQSASKPIDPTSTTVPASLRRGRPSATERIETDIVTTVGTVSSSRQTQRHRAHRNVVRARLRPEAVLSPRLGVGAGQAVGLLFRCRLGSPDHLGSRFTTGVGGLSFQASSGPSTTVVGCFPTARRRSFSETPWISSARAQRSSSPASASKRCPVPMKGW